MVRCGRREFIGLIGAAVVWPLTAQAQKPGRRPIIGVLGTASASNWSSWMAAFVQRLHDLGWIEGRTVDIEYRWSDGRPARMTEIAAELVRLNVDVIVTAAGAVAAVKQATSEIPTVFAIANQPVANGLIASLARPGGNVTGLSTQGMDVAGKRFELLREIVPGLRRLAILANAEYSDAMSEMREVETMARKLDLEVLRLEIRRADDIAPGFERLAGKADALYVAVDGLVGANSTRIIASALSARLPMIFNTRAYAEAGALVAYGPNFPDLFRRAAEYVDKILRGAKPENMPVEQPTRFDLTVNLKTAKALGLEIPATLLARADEVIE
jgi:putative ABC transport system substrate-binding protein